MHCSLCRLTWIYVTISLKFKTVVFSYTLYISIRTYAWRLDMDYLLYHCRQRHMTTHIRDICYILDLDQRCCDRVGGGSHLLPNK
jgi:hypothetical protein